MVRWRWDQGRLAYFQYDSLVRIARALLDLNGVKINQPNQDPLRLPLEASTGLPFSPVSYRVWRNYARVFECSLLATSIEGKLFATDFCMLLQLAADVFGADQYFNLLFSRFSYPFPLFEGYDPTARQIFPFLAIMKFVMAREGSGASLDEVFSYVIGNGCTGVEDLSYYAGLRSTSRSPIGDERRQVREMMCVMGQATYMKWISGRLYIDTERYDEVLGGIHPRSRSRRCTNAIEELCRMTVVDERLDVSRFDVEHANRIGDFELDFAVPEGQRIFRTHGRIERSPLLRRMYFREHARPICDACHLDVQDRYPWTTAKNLLELHHILPLSATLNVQGTTTRLDDIVPLCPNCHKGIHVFYRVELGRLGRTDFETRAMAREVYNRAKAQIVA